MEQQNIFEVDEIGRKAKLMGLSADHESALVALDAGARLHAAMCRYQIGVVDCEMKRLSAGDRAVELTRFWSDTYIAYDSLGRVLAKWAPINEALNVQVAALVDSERKATAESKIDEGYQKLVDDTAAKEPRSEDRKLPTDEDFNRFMRGPDAPKER